MNIAEKVFGEGGFSWFAQGNSAGFGYAFSNNIELSGILSLGVLGADNETNSFVDQVTNAGVNLAYLYPFNSGLKAGVEVLSSYAFSDVINDINYDHAIYQAGIKFQQSWAIGAIGIRYRSFFDYSIYNGAEVYIKLGMRFRLTSR